MVMMVMTSHMLAKRTDKRRQRAVAVACLCAQFLVGFFLHASNKLVNPIIVHLDIMMIGTITIYGCFHPFGCGRGTVQALKGLQGSRRPGRADADGWPACSPAWPSRCLPAKGVTNAVGGEKAGRQQRGAPRNPAASISSKARAVSCHTATLTATRPSPQGRTSVQMIWVAKRLSWAQYSSSLKKCVKQADFLCCAHTVPS